MSLPKEIDFDKILVNAYVRVRDAIDDWNHGRIYEEHQLIGDLIRNLTKRERACDVGTYAKIAMRSQVAPLHRQGAGATDAFGCDLAITVIADDIPFVKTAFLQLKITDRFKAALTKSQVDRTLAHDFTKNRSFIVGLDKGRLGVRIESAATVSAAIGSAVTMSIDASGWDPLGRWLWRWLSCELGEASIWNDPTSPESMLQAYVQELPVDELWAIAWHRAEPPNFNELPIPASRWLVLFIGEPNTDLIRVKKKAKR